MDDRKMYAHLVGVIDNALDLLEEGDLVKAAPIRELLQNALLEAEEAYIREPEDISLSESHLTVSLFPKEMKQPPSAEGGGFCEAKDGGREN